MALARCATAAASITMLCTPAAAAAAAARSLLADAPPPASNATSPCTGLLCMDNWWDQSSPSLWVSWVVIFTASPFAVVSLVLLILGVLELRGAVGPPACGTSFLVPNVVCVVLWPLFLALSVYTVVTGQNVMLVYVVWSALAALAHAIYLHHRRVYEKARQLDHPRQQLLTSQKHNSSDKGGAKVASSTALAADDEPAKNPFTVGVGLIPGTSQYGYQIFVPDADMAYTGLPSAGTPGAAAGGGGRGSSGGGGTGRK